jgi:hypothetical protein
MDLRGVPRSGALLVAALGTALTACSPAALPTPPPLSLQLLQNRYLAAAAAYNSSESAILGAENSYCASSTADLPKCKTALEHDRQATLAFDKALRAIPFPPAYQAAVSKLLSDDAQLEQTLQQAASGATLSADATLFAQLALLYSTTTQDGAKLRSDLSLPSITGGPSPAASPT